MARATIQVESDDGQWTFEVAVPYYVEPYRQAVVNADPADCHEEEGGVFLDGEPEVLSINVAKEVVEEIVLDDANERAANEEGQRQAALEEKWEAQNE